MLQLNFQPFPTIQTERLLLRAVLKKDAAAMFGLRSNTEVLRYIGKAPMKSLSEAKKLIETILNNQFENDAIMWAIALKENPGQKIGNICYWRIDKPHFRAELGYILHPAHWNKGIMNEAIKPVIDYGFNSMKLHSIEANIDPGNSASEALLKKNGFIKEGHIRENYFFDGKFLDTVIFSRLR